MHVSPDTTLTAEANPTSTPAVGRTKAMRRIGMVCVAAAGMAVVASACTPEDVARDAINKNFGSLSGTATQIATCESRLEAGAVSPGGGNVGLFQINRVNAGWIKSTLGYNWNQMTDPYVNARVAKALYNEAHGWSPWHGTCGGRLGI